MNNGSGSCCAEKKLERPSSKLGSELARKAVSCERITSC